MVDRSGMRKKPAAPKKGRGWLSRIADALSTPIGGVKLGEKSPAEIREMVRSLVAAGDARAAVPVALALVQRTQLPHDQKMLAEVFDRALIVPEAVTAYLRYAEQLLLEGRAAMAVGALRRVVALDESCGRAHELIGEAFLVLKQTGEAFNAFSEAMICYERAELIEESERVERRIEQVAAARRRDSGPRKA